MQLNLDHIELAADYVTAARFVAALYAATSGRSGGEGSGGGHLAVKKPATGKGVPPQVDAREWVPRFKKGHR